MAEFSEKFLFVSYSYLVCVCVFFLVVTLKLAALKYC